MNLNPLKKDDNTDALVKALEDANSTGADAPVATPAAPAVDQPVVTPSGVTDSAVIAADPQVTGADLNLPVADDVAAPAPAPVASDVPVAAADTSLSFDGNDLPAGLSDDASAHLPATGDGGELDDVKKSALEQLRPLIEKLDLEPADKFDKYLMMLRASDDPALIKPAFDAAQGIGGEKEKAQALLDIINEINYISASKEQSPTV